MLACSPTPDGLILLVDKGYRDAATENRLGERGVTVVRPPAGVAVRVPQRVLALTAAI
jgi:hypothetical protein